MAKDSTGSLWAARLEREWRLLAQLAEQNPARLTDLAQHDSTFHLTLRNTPALPLPSSHQPEEILTTHRLRLEFPEFFPAVPLELYLQTPVRHPNIHPTTGFVCLWERHRAANTAEVALHKTAAILGWRLHNAQPVHVMQPDALPLLASPGGEALQSRLAAPALRGVPSGKWNPAAAPVVRRRRLF